MRYHHILLDLDGTVLESHYSILGAMAYAGDGLVEAVCAPDYRWVWAVQWHPEFSFRRDADSRKLFRAFVAAAEGRASGEHGEESA